MSVKFVFTDHAIDRYVQRHAPGLDRESARDLLYVGAQDAVRLKQKTVLGHTQWKIGAAMVVTKRDEGSDEEVAVTILPAYVNKGRNAVPDEELAMALALVEERGAIVIEPALTMPMPEFSPTLPPEPSISALELKSELRSRSQKGHPKEPSAKTLAYLAHVDYSIEKMREKTLRIIASSKAYESKVRDALRVAMRALTTIGHEDARAAVEEIKAIEPGFLTQGFIHKGLDG